MKKIQTISFITPRQAAFSLIELLVVISVISLLLSIAIPVLGRARSAAYQTVCQSRLHQWALAFEVYATQNSGLYPHIDGLDRNASPADNFGWVDMLPPLLGEKSWRDYKFWNKPDKKTIFQCPMAEPAGGNLYNYNPLKVGFFSYAMNSCLELDKNCWPPYDQPTGNNMPPFLNTASIKMPWRVVLLFDQLLDPTKGYNTKKINPSAGKYCGSYPKAFSAQHPRQKGRLGGNILFCDYHIEWTASVWKPEWPDDLEVPPRSDFNWFPY